MASPFRAHPRANGEVVDIIERTLVAARLGLVQAVVIVPVNPVNIVEPLFAGDLSQVRSTALLGGLLRATVELASRK